MEQALALGGRKTGLSLEARYDAIFTQRTSFATLNQLLKRLHAHKQKLLLVLILASPAG